jgi:hypothetical protein
MRPFIRLKPGQSWPDLLCVRDAVRVTAVAGYGAAAAQPAPVKQAQMLMIGDWFANRESDGATDTTRVPNAARALLDGHKPLPRRLTQPPDHKRSSIAMLLENLKIILSIIGTQTNAKDLSDAAGGPGRKDRTVVHRRHRRRPGAGHLQRHAHAGRVDQRKPGPGRRPGARAGRDDHLQRDQGDHRQGRDANTGNLRVGAGVANAFQGFFGASAIGVLVTPDGLLVLIDPSATGQAVTGGTGDLLRIENLSAGSSDYDIYIIGEGTVA